MRSKRLVISAHAVMRKIRNQRGSHLVELVVALGATSFVMLAAMQAWSQVFKMSTAGQNQVIAAHIAQEILDSARNQRYSTLAQYVGTTHELLVNRTGAVQPSSPLSPRPLMLDFENLNYKNYSVDGGSVRGNSFHGTVRETISDAGNGTLRVAVNISWPSENGRSRELNMSTLISQYGIHN